jgi:hypothetical protein
MVEAAREGQASALGVHPENDWGQGVELVLVGVRGLAPEKAVPAGMTALEVGASREAVEAVGASRERASREAVEAVGASQERASREAVEAVALAADRAEVMGQRGPAADVVGPGVEGAADSGPLEQRLFCGWRRRQALKADLK